MDSGELLGRQREVTVKHTWSWLANESFQKDRRAPRVRLLAAHKRRDGVPVRPRKLLTHKLCEGRGQVLPFMPLLWV
jgi:hypothetical protein